MDSERPGTRIDLLGDFRITSADGSELPVHGKKHRALVALVVMARGQAISREKATGALWSSRSQRQAQGSLRQALTDLRRDLNRNGTNLLLVDRNRIALRADSIVADVLEFQRLCERDDVDSLKKAVALYRGAFLEGIQIADSIVEEWIRETRQQQQDRLRTALARLVAQCLETGDLENGAVYAGRMLQLDAADEAAHRALMHIHAANSEQAQAMRQFQRCKQLLREEYQTSPSPETVAVYEQIKSGRDISGGRFTETISRTDRPGADGTLVGVFPLACTTGTDDPVGEHISEEMIGALSRFRWFEVAPRSISFPARAGGGEAAEKGRELGFRYIIDGSVRRQRRSVRIAIELIDVNAASVVWGGRFDGKLDSQGDCEPMLLSQIVARIEVQLRVHEGRRALAKPLDMLSAREGVMRALHGMHEMTQEALRNARTLLERARELEPEYAPAYSWSALWEIFCIGQGWADPLGSPLTSAGTFAREAVKWDPEDATALAISGHYEAFVMHEFDQAIDLFERALDYNPHSCFAWMLSSATLSYSGKPDEALRRLDHADSICPVQPHYRFMYNSAHCIAYTFSHQHEEAAIWGRKTVRENPNFSNGIKQLLISLGHMRLHEEAAQHLRRLLELDPGFSIAAFRKSYPFRQDADRQHSIRGLELAGVPAGEPEER